MVTRDEVRSQCALLTEAKGWKISTNAEELAYRVISAVETDPNPFWIETNESEREGFARGLLEKLPDMLENTPGAAQVAQITTFQLLHSLTLHLDTWCPISK